MSRFDTEEQSGGAGQESSILSVSVKDDATMGVAIRKDAKGNSATPSPIVNLMADCIWAILNDVSAFNENQLKIGSMVDVKTPICGFNKPTLDLIQAAFKNTGKTFQQFHEQKRTEGEFQLWLGGLAPSCERVEMEWPNGIRRVYDNNHIHWPVLRTDGCIKWRAASY